MANQSTMTVKAGIVLILGLVGLIGFSLKSDGKGFFKQTYSLNSSFSTAKGLEPGSQVVLAGVQVGNVKDLALDLENGMVNMTINIDASVKIPNDSRASVRQKSLLGAYHFYISPGTYDAPALQEGDTLKTEEFKDLQDILAEIGSTTSGPGTLFTKIEEMVDENRENIRKATESFAEIGPKTNELLDTLNGLSASIEEGEGTIGKLAKSDDLYNKIDGIANDLSSFSQSLNNGDSAISKLMNDEEFSNRIDNIVTDIEEFSSSLNTGEGTLGKLMNDSAMADKIEATFDNAEAVSAKLREAFEGEDNAFSGSFDKLNTALDSFVSIGEKIDEGKGTLGLLINDPEIYNSVRDAVNQVQRTFEETEEQSVMRTFLGVFFGSVI